MANYPCLVRRNNTWYVRKRVPNDLADYISKKEVKRSLKTQDQKEAMKKYHRGLAVIESEFETARIQINNPNAHNMLSTYDDEGIKELVYD